MTMPHCSKLIFGATRQLSTAPALPKYALFRNVSPRAPFKERRTRELIAALATLHMCRVAPLAPSLFALCRRIGLTALLRGTFFNHFCAGETEAETAAALRALSARGMLPILDVAIEADVASDAVADGLPRFLASIRSAAHVPHAAVAIKVTALASPRFLLRLSAALAGLPRADFDAVAPLARCVECPSAARDVLAKLNLGSDLANLQQLYGALDQLATAAAAANVKLMVDAEQTYFQPAIDMLGLHIAAKHNRLAPCIYNTYQMYLKSAPSRLTADVQLAQRDGWHFAAKIVRGAYLVTERARAEQLSTESPVFDSIEQTHEAYDSAVALLLRADCAVIVASHNIASLAAAAERVSAASLSAKVAFAQLKGMHDVVGHALVSSGLRVYKYMPYGHIDEVMPYLIRRAQENSSLMGSAALDRQLLSYEIVCRIKEMFGSAGGDASANSPKTL